ncbi:MAG: hypothetical protein ACI4KF_02540 [Huintestinicola sp.]
MFANEDVIAEQTSDIKYNIEIYPPLFVGLAVMFVVSMVLFCRKEKTEQ